MHSDARTLFSENAEIPTELRKDALDLQKTLDWDDDGGDGEFRNVSYCIVWRVRFVHRLALWQEPTKIVVSECKISGGWGGK